MNFRTGRQIPKDYVTDETANKKKKTGRLQNKTQRDAFMAAVRYLQENDEEQITISELCTKMEEYLEDAQCQGELLNEQGLRLLVFFYLSSASARASGWKLGSLTYSVGQSICLTSN